MINCSYYRKPNIPDNNFVNNDAYIQLNCTGRLVSDYNLSAETVRRDFYMIYVYQGNLNFFSPQMQYSEMRSGDLIIIGCDTPFYYKKPDDSKLIYYWAHFTGYGCDEILKKCGLETNIILSPGNHDAVIESFQSLFDKFLIRDDFFDLDSSQALISLFITLGRYTAQSDIDKLHSYRKRLGKSISYINENFSSQISVQTLASMEFMSISRYRTIFNYVMKMPPQDYITMVRLNHACELLSHAAMTVNEISQICGYSDQRYFSRIFTKNLGTTPTKYRCNEK